MHQDFYTPEERKKIFFQVLKKNFFVQALISLIVFFNKKNFFALALTSPGA